MGCGGLRHFVALKYAISRAENKKKLRVENMRNLTEFTVG